MAQPIGALRAELSASAAAFERDMGRARQAVRQHGAAMQRDFNGVRASAVSLQSAVAGLRRGLAAFGIGIGLGATTRAVRGIVSEVSELGKQARSIGITAEALQELRFGFGQAGVNAGELTRALENFSQRLGEADERGGRFAEMLERNGIALRDADGKMRPVLDLLMDYADLVKNAESEQQAMNITALAFGDRAGRRMVRALRDGAAGVDELMQRARDAGIVIGNDLVDAAERVDDRFDRLAKQISTGIKREILETIDAVDRLLERFRSIDQRTLVAPLQRELDMLALESRRLKESMRTQEEILRHDPTDPAARESLEAHQRRLDAIAERYEAIMARIAELNRQPEPRAGVVFEEDDGSGGGRSGGLSDEERLDRITDAIRRRTEALRLEAETMGLSLQEIERRRIALELEQAIQSAGIPITEETRAKIEELSDAYARAVAAVDEAAKAHDAHNRRLIETQRAGEDAARALATFAGDMVKDFGNAEDAARRLLQRITDLVTELLVVRPLMNLLSGPLTGVFGGAVGTPLNLIPGFRHGGSFVVGGAGGIDSQLVQFRATPGEQVDVHKRGRDNRPRHGQPQEQASVVFQRGSIVIQTPDPQAFRQSQGQIMAGLARAVARGQRGL